MGLSLRARGNLLEAFAQGAGSANALSVKTLDLATRRVRAERMPEWQSAFNQSGRGSSYARASIIGERIYDRAAPIPDVTPSPDRNSFLHEVAAVVESVCDEVGANVPENDGMSS